jgi:TusA-related sulfurtransferase
MRMRMRMVMMMMMMAPGTILMIVLNILKLIQTIPCFYRFMLSVTERRTDRQRDGGTDKAEYRDA